jgi:hypothetical protein
MEDEIQLEFRRFSAEKQEQVRQLVAYTQLMGLTGADLVSIGGKLERMRKRRELESNLAIGLSYKCVPVGQSKKLQELNKNSKWYWTDGNGTKWRFERERYYSSTIVTNCSSGRQKTFYIDDLVTAPRTNVCANIMANVHAGYIILNF